jgi:hypothetical protein
MALLTASRPPDALATARRAVPGPPQDNSKKRLAGKESGEMMDSCVHPDVHNYPPSSTDRQAGLIETDPTSELVVISCGEVADLRTVTVDVPTNVWLLIL